MACFRRTGGRFRASGVLLALVLLLAVPGCSMGYTNLHPGENSGLYQHLFADIISLHDEPYWLWVRGTISGDLDGDGKVTEELVLATIQKGTQRQPGPIEMAFIVACKILPDGTRQAVARQLLFDHSPIPRSPRPDNDVDHIVDNPFTRCRAQMIQDKVTLTETVVVYFWTDPTPCSVWYVGYGMHDGKFVKNLETVLWQSTPGVLTANLDRSVEASPYGYQLVFGVSALPESIVAKLGKPSEAPLWGHVFARNAHGYYEQANERFADNYHKLEGPWNQAYLKAIVKGLPPEDLAWFEYYLSIMNHFTDNHEMAEAFIAKAGANAKDQVLKDAIPKIEALISAGKAGRAAGKKQDAPPPQPSDQPSDWQPEGDWDPEEDWVPSDGDWIYQE